MPTIKDVAKKAGVAPITASRVINESGYVSAETRCKVMAAVTELGYIPNRVARSLRSKQTHTLALVLTDITNPFWTTVARGVEDAARDQGFSVILCNTDESESKQDEYVRVLLQKQVDGFLLVPAYSTSVSVELIQKQNVPVVVIDRQVPIDVDVVRSDSREGSYELTRLLIDQGCKRIAMLNGPKEVSTAIDRMEGYSRAVEEANIAIDEALVMYGGFTQHAGYLMTQEILKLDNLPDALFTGNNFIAVGAMRALREAGLRVPEDIALVTFDDLPDTFMVEPFLTVAAQQAYEMGRTATDLLLSRLEESEPSEPREVLLPTKLIIRRSSGVTD